MDMDICPCCLHKFETEAWADGQCPCCATSYCWDSGPILCWQYYDEPKKLKVYSWPYLYDEYFWSIESLVIAESLEEARELAKAKIIEYYDDRIKYWQEQYHLTDDGSLREVQSELIEKLYRITPNIYPVDIKTATLKETNR